MSRLRSRILEVTMTRLKWARKAVGAKNSKSKVHAKKISSSSITKPTSKKKIKALQRGLWNQPWHLVNDNVCIVSTKALLAVFVVPMDKNSFKNKC